MQESVNILGTAYVIKKYKYNDLDVFKKRDIDGYCDCIAKEIVYCDMITYPSLIDETEQYCNLVEKEILRHEIIHAFLNESGLRDSAGQPVGAWSKNEEMIDWIATQSPKIFSVFKELDVL